MSSTAPVHALTAKYFPRAIVSLRWAAIAFALLGAIFLAPAAWGASGPMFQGGTGTASDPYLVADANQLCRFRDAVNDGNDFAGKTVKLAEDIDLAHVEWTPIGAGTRKGSGAASGSTPFAGTFDGAGHKVSGLSITTSPDADFAVGLFGIVKGGTVRDVVLDGVAIDVPGSELAGGAVGLLIDDGTVSGVSVSGSVSAHAGVGGVVGRMTLSGTISDCANSAAVTAMTGVGNVGGIVGAAYYTTDTGEMVIEGCTNTGTVKGTQAAGGIAGLCSAFVSECGNNGAVEAEHYSVGGVVGEQKNYGGIHHCTNSASVTCEDAGGYGCGGIAGWVRYDGAAAAYPASSAVPVTDNENSGEIHGGNDAGGIVGCFYNAGTVTGNTSTAPALTSSRFAGGIVGNLQNAPLDSLPSSVIEGIAVVNNVSTTPLDKISAPLRDTFAYNNTPADFTVDDNSAGWVASTNSLRYAVLQRALDNAPDDGTVTLTADLADADSLSLADGRTVTLDLNGHNLAFAKAPGVTVSWGAFVITGIGQVSAPATVAPTGTAPTLFEVTGSSEKPAAVKLKGGSYNVDVEPYVASKYAELVRDQKDSAGKFSVLPAKEARAEAQAKVDADGETVYYESAKAARAAAAAEPGAKVTVLDDESDKPSAPDSPNDGSDVDSDGDHGGNSGTATTPGSADGTAPATTPAAHEGDNTPGFLDLHGDGGATDTGSATGTTSGATTTATTAPHKTTIKPAGAVPQTGDSLWEALLSIGLLAIVSGAAVALARTRSKRTK